MSITPEQFAKLVTKEELNELKFDVKGIKKDIGDIKGTLDFIVSMFQKLDSENTANTEAHNKMNRDLFRIKTKLDIKDMEVVEPVE